MKSKQPRRKSMRLQGFDYRTAAYYFVTICTHQREWLFEEAEAKRLVELTLQELLTWKGFTHVELDAFVVMPNHIHVIFIFIDDSLAGDDFKQEPKRLSKSLGSAVANYKANLTNRLRGIRRDFDLKVWQRGYYDRIIRDEDELNQIREYIRLNPERWENDRDYETNVLDVLLGRMNYRV
ncbi:MAG: putative transposase [Candidatus Promineifilaceae bacterium]|jgi:putative transposase